MKYFIIIISFFYSTLSNTQNVIKWMSWDEALSAHAHNPKKVVVYFYTNWCKYCKKMDNTTFQSDDIAKFVNSNYYAVKFDAQCKKTKIFKGKEYGNNGSGFKNFHELAILLTHGRLSFPTVAFLDENLSLIQPVGGFFDTENFEMIITYFADNHYTHTPWRIYTKNYKLGKCNNTPLHVPVNKNRP